MWICFYSGIGVDDAFVVIETWKRIDKQHHDKPVKERLALTMQHAGVSVTVTSITDFAAFAAGVSSVKLLKNILAAQTHVFLFGDGCIVGNYCCVTINEKSP